MLLLSGIELKLQLSYFLVQIWNLSLLRYQLILQPFLAHHGTLAFVLHFVDFLVQA